jgi:hypothetical protein
MEKVIELWASTFVLFTKPYEDEKIRGRKIAGTCSTHENYELRAQHFGLALF